MILVALFILLLFLGLFVCLTVAAICDLKECSNCCTKKCTNNFITDEVINSKDKNSD